MISIWLGVAFAFQPTQADQGIEPHRLQTPHPQVQAQLQLSDDFRRWQSDHGPWSAQFDEVTNRPLAMWGRGVPMPVDGGQSELVAALANVLEQHSSLMGTEPGVLTLRSANYVARVDTWYIDFDVLRDGLSTYRSGISARIKHGNLILLRVVSHPDAPVVGDLTIGEMQAVRQAIAQGRAPDANHTDPLVEPMLLEQRTLHGLQLRKVYKVTTHTKEPVGIWVAFVDGASGDVLSVHNEVRFITGTVSGNHHPRTLDGSALVTSPLPLAYVDNGGDDDFTNADGDYVLAGNGPVDSVLAGDYLTVFNNAGGEGFKSSSAGDFTWTTSDATQAEISTYVFLHHVQAWGERVAPEVSMVTSPLTSIVNIGDFCNAYFDGNLNFFSTGYGCNNTGQIADVNYHEWGHGFHAYSLQAGYFDGSLSEGASDVVAFLQTGDNLIAPFFGTNGSAIRNVAPNQIYPQDYVANDYYVHSNGLIFGGAMWDLWDLLIDAEGFDPGTESTEEIFTGLLKGGPDVPASVYEALVADDDDGDLSNGTPHSCSINEAFGQHGLGSVGIGTDLVPFHEPVINLPAEVVNALRIETLAAQAACVSLDNADADLVYRVDGGSWLTATASSVNDGLEGDLPAQSMGSFVEYYFEGTDDEGNAFQAPATGQVAPYTAFIGDVLEVHCFDFENDDGGFTHELLAGEASDGADDWQWGSPAGQSFDPNSAWSGNNVWGNDLGNVVNGLPYNGDYQADKTNRLTSPEANTGHYTGVFLQYRRWLHVEDGLFDQARVYANNTEVWSNWASGGGEDHHQDTVWMTHSVDLGGLADRTDIDFAWEIQSDQGLEFSGWTIDDVCIYAPNNVDNRLPILDFEATVDDQGFVNFTWTNPEQGPFTELRIVRNDDEIPSSVEDGEVVFSQANPTLGDSATGTDDNESLTAGFYAVYTTDGEEWLSWTIEGWNALGTDASSFTDLEERPEPTGDDDDDDDGGGGDDDDDDDDGGVTLDKETSAACGCSQPAGGHGLWLGALGLLAWRRRR